MILHLAGSTETARALIADRFLDDRKNWRYMALEDSINPEEERDDAQEVMNLMLACDCARDHMVEGFHLIVTYPHMDLVERTCSELPGPHISVLLDTADATGRFDHVLSPARCSPRDVIETLGTMIAEYEP